MSPHSAALAFASIMVLSGLARASAVPQAPPRPPGERADIIVAQDGSGDFRAIQAGPRLDSQGQRSEQDHPRPKRRVPRKALRRGEPRLHRRRGPRRDAHRVRRTAQDLARDAPERLRRGGHQHRRRCDGPRAGQPHGPERLRAHARRARPPVRDPERGQRHAHLHPPREGHRRWRRHAQPLEHRVGHVLPLGLRFRGLGGLRLPARVGVHHEQPFLRPQPDRQHLARRQQGPRCEVRDPAFAIRRRERLSPRPQQPRRAVLPARLPVLGEHGRPADLPAVRARHVPLPGALLLLAQPPRRRRLPLVRRQPGIRRHRAPSPRRHGALDLCREVGSGSHAPAGAALRRRAAASRRGSGREPVSDAIALDSRAQRGVAQRAFRDEQPAAVPRQPARGRLRPRAARHRHDLLLAHRQRDAGRDRAGADMVVHDRGHAPCRAGRRLDRHRRQRLGPRLHRAAHVPRDGREHGPQRAEFEELSRRGPLARGASPRARTSS